MEAHLGQLTGGLFSGRPILREFIFVILRDFIISSNEGSRNSLVSSTELYYSTKERQHSFDINTKKAFQCAKRLLPLFRSSRNLLCS